MSELGSEEKELCQLSGIESTVSDFLTWSLLSVLGEIPGLSNPDEGSTCMSSIYEQKWIATCIVGWNKNRWHEVKKWLFKFLFYFSALSKIPLGVFFFESRFASSRFLEWKQGYSNLRRLVFRATFFFLLLNMHWRVTFVGSRYGTCLACGILRWRPDFWKILCTPELNLHRIINIMPAFRFFTLSLWEVARLHL